MRRVGKDYTLKLLGYSRSTIPPGDDREFLGQPNDNPLESIPMNQKTLTPLADIIVYDTEEPDEFAFHGMTDTGRKLMTNLTYGIRTQESSLRVIHTDDIDSVFEVLNEYGLVILTL